METAIKETHSHAPEGASAVTVKGGKFYLFIKRLFDIVVSFQAGILLLSPLRDALYTAARCPVFSGFVPDKQ